jgi:hypothetical protein
MKNIEYAVIKETLPTSGRIGRIAKKVVEETDIKTAAKIMKGAVDFKELSYQQRAELLKEIVKRMKSVLGSKKTKEIFISCGTMCCGATSRKLVKKAMEKSRSLKELIDNLNKKHIGGGRLKLKNARTITGGYDRCYCGMVSKARMPYPDLTYCHCSTGWYKQLFETALNKRVEVKILQSIVCGAKTCEFIITIIE